MPTKAYCSHLDGRAATGHGALVQRALTIAALLVGCTPQTGGPYDGESMSPNTEGNDAEDDGLMPPTDGTATDTDATATDPSVTATDPSTTMPPATDPSTTMPPPTSTTDPPTTTDPSGGTGGTGGTAG